MTDETKPGMKRWIKVVFVLSLALNLIIIGLVGGAALRFGGADKHHRFSDRAFTPTLFALDREDRREIGRNIRKAYRERESKKVNEIRLFNEIADAIEADPIDVDAVLAASSELDGGLAERREIAQQAWLDKVSEMSHEDRKAYAARIRDILENPKKWRKPPLHKKD